MERQRLVLIDPVLVVEGVQMKMAFVDSVNRFPPLFFCYFNVPVKGRKKKKRRR